MMDLKIYNRAEQSPKQTSMQSSKESVAAVIVAFNPDTDFGKRLDIICQQVACVIIVDNCSAPAICEMVTGVPSDRMHIIENQNNMGIAVALNQGVLRAAELGFSWVLTLDQDTEIDTNMVDRLLSILSHVPDRESIGIIGSNARSKHSGRLYIDYSGHPGEFIETKTVVTSGTLMSVRAYEQVGPFRDDFFIEGVDLEYCLRMRQFGFRVLMSCKPLMTHAAGKMEEHCVMGRVVLVANHAPWRYYYTMRNLVKIVCYYVWQEPQWTLILLLNLIKMLIKIILFEDNRMAKLRCILQGVCDGLLKSDHNKVDRPHT